jgi:hypothetical protein
MPLMLQVAARQPSSKEDISSRKAKNKKNNKKKKLLWTKQILSRDHLLFSLIPQNQDNLTTHFPIFLLQKWYAEQ